MSLKYALLGFLNYRSMTGYQLKQYFDQSVRNFWPASLSQIYPTLNKMRNEGLLDVEVIYQENLPNAKLYHITDKGREELLNWLREPLELHVMRSPLLIKLYFSSIIDKSHVIAQLREQMKLSQERLDSCIAAAEHIRRGHGPGDEMHESAVYWNAVADFGVKYEEFFLSWCEETISKLESIRTS